MTPPPGSRVSRVRTPSARRPRDRHRPAACILRLSKSRGIAPKRRSPHRRFAQVGRSRDPLGESVRAGLDPRIRFPPLRCVVSRVPRRRFTPGESIGGATAMNPTRDHGRGRPRGQLVAGHESGRQQGVRGHGNRHNSVRVNQLQGPSNKKVASPVGAQRALGPVCLGHGVCARHRPTTCGTRLPYDGGNPTTR